MTSAQCWFSCFWWSVWHIRRRSWLLQLFLCCQFKSHRWVADIVHWSHRPVCDRNSSGSCQHSTARSVLVRHRCGHWWICWISKQLTVCFYGTHCGVHVHSGSYFGHDHEPCKNRWTSLDAVSNVDLWGPRNRVLHGAIIPYEKGHSWEACTGWDMRGGNVLKVTHKRQHVAVQPACHH